MDLNTKVVTASLQDGVLLATITHPPANAIAQGVLADLTTILDYAETADEVRVLVITGSGDKLFSAGADITEFADMQAGKKPEYDGNQIYFRIENFPKVVIAAMQGSAFGGGLELALSCHLRIVAENAAVGLPEVKLGFMPGWGGTQRLSRLVGKCKAMELILTGDFLSAKDAERLGMINATCPKDEVVAKAMKLAAKLAAGAPLAQREIIKAVNNGLETNLADAVLKVEGAGTLTLLKTKDFAEGAKAFLEKRKADFIGK